MIAWRNRRTQWTGEPRYHYRGVDDRLRDWLLVNYRETDRWRLYLIDEQVVLHHEFHTPHVHEAKAITERWARHYEPAVTT